MRKYSKVYPVKKLVNKGSPEPTDLVEITSLEFQFKTTPFIIFTLDGAPYFQMTNVCKALNLGSPSTRWYDIPELLRIKRRLPKPHNQTKRGLVNQEGFFYLLDRARDQERATKVKAWLFKTITEIEGAQIPF